MGSSHYSEPKTWRVATATAYNRTSYLTPMKPAYGSMRLLEGEVITKIGVRDSDMLANLHLMIEFLEPVSAVFLGMKR